MDGELLIDDSAADRIWDAHRKLQRSFIEYIQVVAPELRRKRDEVSGSFEQWVDEHCPFGKKIAYRLLEAEKVLGNLLGPMGPKGNPHEILPSSERQCRELAKLPGDDQAEAWWDIVEECDPQEPTAANIRELVNRLLGHTERRFGSIIQPDDSWTFNPPVYGRIDGENGHGYIPGDLYVNVFWYWVGEGETFVDLMAGGGMAWHVYQDRHSWMPEDHQYQFTVKMYDLTPRGKYKRRIKQNDATKSVPPGDVIFMDIPYFGMVAGQYGESSSDLANQDVEGWMEGMRSIARNCKKAQRVGQKVVVVVPNFADHKERVRILFAGEVVKMFAAVGYELYDQAFSSRAIQQSQNKGMAFLNNSAKRNRLMLTDVSQIQCYVRIG